MWKVVKQADKTQRHLISQQHGGGSHPLRSPCHETTPAFFNGNYQIKCEQILHDVLGFPCALKGMFSDKRRLSSYPGTMRRTQGELSLVDILVFKLSQGFWFPAAWDTQWDSNKSTTLLMYWGAELEFMYAPTDLDRCLLEPDSSRLSLFSSLLQFSPVIQHLVVTQNMRLTFARVQQ